MDKDRLSRDQQPVPLRPSLAEEQQRAFEEDQRRLRRPGLMRWPGFLFRN
ncbi:hypothetical protein GCM10022281_19660 [Sphingomonas rosea]|uniref:Uncharacterized protein n=1 Tax=Sphingomonas rosea TaxID=335605 RepID=A0ABP7UA87_9SPHN